MLHFLLPFVITGCTIIHLVLLHSRGSKNPLGVESYVDKVCFRPLFAFKDLLGIVLLLWALVAVCMYCPTIFMDAENLLIHLNYLSLIQIALCPILAWDKCSMRCNNMN